MRGAVRIALPVSKVRTKVPTIIKVRHLSLTSEIEGNSPSHLTGAVSRSGASRGLFSSSSDDAIVTYEARGSWVSCLVVINGRTFYSMRISQIVVEDS
jgi:hypothetical protein